MAASLVTELGYKNIKVYKDGVPGWVKAGYPINREKAVPRVEIPSLNSKQVMELLGDVFVLDVRPEFHYEGIFIKGSYKIPIHQLSKRYREIPMDKKVVVVDGHGNPSWIPACWFLKSKGYSNISWLQGDIEGWVKEAFPLEK